MPNQQNQQGTSSKQDQVPFPTVPKAMEHRISMKWLTMEALSKVNKLLSVDGSESRVVLLTPWGRIEGRMHPIKSSYAESYHQQNGRQTPDIASMVTHIRTDLLRLYEQEESKASSDGEGKQKKQDQENAAGGLEIVDTAPIISLTNVVLTSGTTKMTLPQLTLFADQVIGFTLDQETKIH